MKLYKSFSLPFNANESTIFYASNRIRTKSWIICYKFYRVKCCCCSIWYSKRCQNIQEWYFLCNMWQKVHKISFCYLLQLEIMYKNIYKYIWTRSLSCNVNQTPNIPDEQNCCTTTTERMSNRKSLCDEVLDWLVSLIRVKRGQKSSNNNSNMHKDDFCSSKRKEIQI